MDNEDNSIDQLEDSIIDHPDAKTREEIQDTSLDETFQKKLNARADQITNSGANHDRRGHHGDDRGDGYRSGSGDGGNNGSVEGEEASDSNGGGVNSIENEYQFLIEKTNLLYEYTDYDSLDVELSEWFTFNDLKVIGTLDSIAARYESSINKEAEHDDIERHIKKFSKLLEKGFASFSDPNTSETLEILLYFNMGKYKTASSKVEQCARIRQTSQDLYKWGLLELLLDAVILFINNRIQHDNQDTDINYFNSANINGEIHLSSEAQSNFFRVLTLLYFVLNVALVEPQNFNGIRDKLSSKDILSKIVQFIEHWKWKPNSSYRVRYLIMITWKLILVEFGDSNHLKACDDFLCDYHEIIHKEGKDLPTNKLTCSPLDYFTFREDLMAKYPLFSKTIGNNNDLIKKDPLEFETARESLQKIDAKNSDYQFYMAMNENSNSLTNLIEMPRTNRSHTISSQLPTQTLHIATPVPSPPSTPSDYMSGGEKIRKSYHLNQGMPFIYPTSDETPIPYAIKEADNILKNSVYESYSNKQLWEERQAFMRQERGFVNEYEGESKESENEHFAKINGEHTEGESKFDYSERLFALFPERKDEIQSLLRIESFYSKSMIYLNSFVEVLLETIKSNKFDYDMNFPEWELNPETSYFTNKLEEQNGGTGQTREKIQFMLMQQLEVVNVKEIALKACTGILSLLLRWFKKNHVLKSWYLASLLFDQQYLSMTMDFLNQGFYNNNIQQMKQSAAMGEANGNVNGINGNSNNNGANIVNSDACLYQNKIMNPKIELPKFEFFNNCLNQFPEAHKYEFINKTLVQDLATRKDSNNINNILISKFNSNFCSSLTNILTVADKILLGNKTQRILTLSDLKPSDMFKVILMNFNNQYINKPILKMLKKLIPYQGRKWKSNNMELISQVYLHCKLNLRDNWLSGKDLENDFNNSYGQEIALRGLLQFYNMKRYPQDMEMLGYEILDSDFTALNLNIEN